MKNKKKVSDLIAEFLKLKKIKHIFGVIGSANSHIFDSVRKLKYTEIICVHHEQAATMAMQTYFRVSNKVTAALVTAGAGSANSITGVMSAWADSIPGIIISGQENSRFISTMKNMRMWGIQGYDSTDMVKNITKYQKRILNPKQTLDELNKAYNLSIAGRPGPVWLDFPINIQGEVISIEKSKKEVKVSKIKNIKKNSFIKEKKVINLLNKAKRPILWLGHGIRLANANKDLDYFLSKISIPVLLSWAGLDMISEKHRLNFGSPGVYGGRSANFILQNSDLIISIGNRMAIPMIGYEHDELARKAKIVQVDIDQLELNKLKDRTSISLLSDAKVFINFLIKNIKNINSKNYQYLDWIDKCNFYKKKYPKIGKEHNDKKNYINSYNFIDRISILLKKNQIITTDMGTALLSGHQVIKIKKGQRLMTSTGLGEMGFGLPAAIGASFAKKKAEVICFNCDGGMMLNIQELQTVVHHKLPIKFFIFNNDGYLMIKHTQKALFNGKYIGTDKQSGISCPNYKKIAKAFNINYFSIKTWADFKKNVPKILNSKKTIICDVFMDPEQGFYPKLSLTLAADGKIVSPPLEDLYPLLPRNQLKKDMIIPILEKSKNI